MLDTVVKIFGDDELFYDICVSHISKKGLKTKQDTQN